jgi:hypothetical protein
MPGWLRTVIDIFRAFFGGGTQASAADQQAADAQATIKEDERAKQVDAADGDLTREQLLDRLYPTSAGGKPGGSGDKGGQ